MYCLYERPNDKLLAEFHYFQFLTEKTWNYSTSMPVIWTGVYTHMRSPSLASLSHLANNCPMHYQIFTLWPWGLTPRPKFTKRWDDLLLTQVYHIAKFHRPVSTQAKDIPYKKSCVQTQKETVNDITQHAYRHVGIIKYRVAC